MTARLFCGVDVGINGAIAFVRDDGSFVDVIDTPTVQAAAHRRQVDLAALACVLRKYAPVFALVEKVSSRPGEGVSSAFSFGQSYGGILGILAALGIPHATVVPVVWKRWAGVPAGAPKSASIQVAKRLLPDAAHHLSRQRDDGRAEAIILAMLAAERRQALQ